MALSSCFEMNLGFRMYGSENAVCPEEISKSLNINHEESLLLTCGKLGFLLPSGQFTICLIFIKTLISA